MYQLEDLSVNQVKKLLAENQTLILPVTVMEPLGLDLPLGLVFRINEAVAKAVSKESQTLTAPLLKYGYSTPFKAFSGVLSTRKNSFITEVADIVRSAIGWGIKRIVFLDGSAYLRKEIDEALKRYKKKLPEDFSYTVVSWQTIGPVRKIVKESYNNLAELWRSEALYTALAKELFNTEFTPSQTKPVDAVLFKKWRKRGMDPEKLAAYAPLCSLSRWSDVSMSKKLFPILIEEICKEIKKGEQ